MRIALASDWYLPRTGGIERQLAGLVEALRAAGHEVTVFTTTPGNDVNVPAVQRLKGTRWFWSDVRFSWRAWAQLRKGLREGQFDVVHAHASVVSPLGFGAALLAHRLGVPVVLTFHSVLLKMRWPLWAADVLFGWSKSGVALSAVSQLVASQLCQALPQAEAAVLPNGIDPRQWQPQRESRAANGPVVVVSTMRLHRKKRPLALLRAFRRARAVCAANGLQVRLLIVGDGGQRPKMDRYIRGHGLSDYVRLLGMQSHAEIAELYRQADIFALASLREAFGLAGLEARNAGLPVIAMQCSGLAEFIVPEISGLLARDDSDFAAQLARLIQDDDLRARLAGAEIDLSRHFWPAVATRHIAVYNDAMARKFTAAAIAQGPAFA